MNICSSWFFLIFVCCCDKRVIGTKFGQNIGTVLFEKNDYGKQCWTNEEFTILNSRRMFQNILPQVKVIDSQNDQYIAHLMDYFHICLESVRKLSVGKTKHLMLKALADTLGGYLRVYILPITKHSYYGGNIKYRNAKMLFELFDELKIFLRTSGAGWLKPSTDIKTVQITPIVIIPPKTSVACNGLITYSTPLEDDKRDRSLIFKRKKRSTMKRGHSRRAVDDNKEAMTGEVTIPFPFLDNEAEPNSIALPFKTDNLQSLYSEKSAFALVKYYIASVKCISSRSSTKTQLQTFNKGFHAWLQQSVRRHLDNEKWYPAFGGVLRVMATLRESGISDFMKGKASGTYQVMPKVNTDKVGMSRMGGNPSPLYKGNEKNNPMTIGTMEIVIIAIVCAVLVWLMVGLSLVCYRFLTKQSDECTPCEAKTTPFAVLYKNEDYCQPDTCPSMSLRKNVCERLKEWWRNKYGRCPGGCQDQDEERYLAAINYCSKDTVSNSNRIYPRKKYAKSTSILPLGMSRNRTSFKHSVCYSSEGSTTYSDSPANPR